MRRGRLPLPSVLIAVLLSGLGAWGATPAQAAPTPSAPAVGASGAPAVGPRSELHAARSFAFALGARLTPENVRRLARRDLVVVDGDDASPAQVRRLKARGAVVLGYLSVGSVESWRPWFDQLRDHRLEPLGDWEGERYTDVAAPEAREALVGSIAPRILGKGFDGLFLDNVDMVETHPAQAAGMTALVEQLAALVHADGRALMAQNGDASIGPLLPFLDGWNREDPTGTYDFDRRRYVATAPADARAAARAIAMVRAAGVLVTATDYFASPTSPAARRAVRIACRAGAVPFVGDIALRQVLRRPATC